MSCRRGEHVRLWVPDGYCETLCGEMRALHVMASMAPEWGGPVPMVCALTAALARRGVRCEIVAACGHRVGSGDTAVSGVPIHRFRTESPARLWTGCSRGLARFLDREVERFDLIHIHELWHFPGYAASRAARRLGIPYVLTVHAALDAWRLRHKGWRKRLYRLAIQDGVLRSAAALHALTRAERSQIAALGLGAPVFVVPNGVAEARPVDDPVPAAALEGLLARHPELAGKRVILFLGRLQAVKGLDVLARSFTLVAGRFPDAVLLIVGPKEDGTHAKVEALLRAGGFLHRAVFTGMLTGTAKLAALRCADLFVLPSYGEGFSMAILEALAEGLPVVISEQCHFPEVAEHRAGFVVEPEPAPVAAALAALLTDAHLRTTMGSKGAALVRARYTWPAVAGAISDRYRTLIAPRSAVGQSVS